MAFDFNLLCPCFFCLFLFVLLVFARRFGFNAVARTQTARLFKLRPAIAAEDAAFSCSAPDHTFCCGGVGVELSAIILCVNIDVNVNVYNFAMGLYVCGAAAAAAGGGAAHWQ